jgi:hypothetical protein
MWITAVWRAARDRWHRLVQKLWPDSPEELTRAEIARLNSELSRRVRRLIRLRQRTDQVRDRLAWQQRQLSEPATAAPDRLGRSVERLRNRLARLEETYQERCRQLERRKRLRSALISGRMQVVDVLLPDGRVDAC